MGRRGERAVANITNDYRLVVFAEPDDPQEVRDLICGVTGIHPTDAMQWVGRSPGIWPQRRPRGEVRERPDGRLHLGVAGEAWRVDRLPDLRAPRTVNKAACLPDGLRISGLHGEPAHWIPWPKLDL